MRIVVKLGRTPRAVSSPTRWKFADDLGHPFGDYFRVADDPPRISTVTSHVPVSRPNKLDLSGGMTQWEVTPLTKLRKKVRLPKLWPTMPGHVLLVRCATKESATPVIAMRMVSQRVGCMNKWKADQQMP
jgi:hypothetical protein